MVVKIGTYYGHFSRIYRSKLSIYLQNYVKNGLIFKITNQIFFFSTQCIILLLFLLFSQIKIGCTLSPPPIITKVYLPLIITKVKVFDNYMTIKTFLSNYSFLFSNYMKRSEMIKKTNFKYPFSGMYN